MSTVIKRDGSKEDAVVEKILQRLVVLSEDIKSLNLNDIARQVFRGLPATVTSAEIDTLLAETLASMLRFPDANTLAARVIISNYEKQAMKRFSTAMNALNQDTAQPVQDENHHGIRYMSDDFIRFVNVHAVELDAAVERGIREKRNRAFSTYESAHILTKYLRRLTSKRLIENPQHLWMRVAVCTCWRLGIEEVVSAYEDLSGMLYIHGTPTLTSAGRKNFQGSSCFLFDVQEDSITSIFDAISRIAETSKWGGGIGMSVQRVRSTGSIIHGTNGRSTGLFPMLRVMQATAKYVNQGGGVRDGAAAVYIEPTHPDIFDILNARRPSTPPDKQLMGLFFGLWVPDRFMQAVESNGEWCLMDPQFAKGLEDVYGEEYNRLYDTYANPQYRDPVYPDEKVVVRRLPARDLWKAILVAQIESGSPYMCSKDSVNRNSNQKHLGVIRCSNLCTEVMEFSGTEAAVCTLASINLVKFCGPTPDKYQYSKLAELVRRVVRRENEVLDLTMYPFKEARSNNLKHRPIGIGVQALQEVFYEMRTRYGSDLSRDVNVKIFATIYYAALQASVQCAKEKGCHESFSGSPASKGILHFDMYGIKPIERAGDLVFNWDEIRRDVVKYGLRNALLVAPMPTVSTSVILGGNTPSFEPRRFHVSARNTDRGDIPQLNLSLFKCLRDEGLLTDEIIGRVITSDDGSINHITEIPEWIRDVFPIASEIPLEIMADMAIERTPYVDQACSQNVFLPSGDLKRLTQYMMRMWRGNTKTWNYYTISPVRTQRIVFDDQVMRKTSTPSAGAGQQVQVSVPSAPVQGQPENPVVAPTQVCRRDNPDCESCSS